jgi:hypothetical protein
MIPVRKCATRLTGFITQPLPHCHRMYAANAFTPWFKLIARDFLFGWWDELLARKKNGKVDVKSLDGLVDGSKVVKMV